VLAVAVALLAFFGPEVNTVDNVSEHVSTSAPAFFNVVEVSNVSVEVRHAPSEVLAPVGLSGLFPGSESLFFPMDPFSIEVLNGFVKGVAVSIVVAVFVKRFIVVDAPLVVVARPGSSKVINVFIREEDSKINFISKFVVPVRVGDFKVFIPLEVSNCDIFFFLFKFILPLFCWPCLFRDLVPDWLPDEIPSGLPFELSRLVNESVPLTFESRVEYSFPFFITSHSER
jgi:hypothetical protein